tara:strand:- start:16 stop:135 length:120 start_codon:yes stop_codon:yes gene_type:complete
MPDYEKFFGKYGKPFHQKGTFRDDDPLDVDDNDEDDADE